MKKTLSYLGIAGVLAVGGMIAFADSAKAQYYGGVYQPSYNYGSTYGSYGYGGSYYSGPTYHPPSVHYDRVYHPTRLHWTPFRGLHTHGHYDVRPHYTPGHFDYQHGNHVHPNPYYHR